MGRYDEALRCYDQAADLKPRRPDSHRYRGVVQLCQEAYAAAADAYTRAIDVLIDRGMPEGGPCWLYYQRAIPLWILGRWAEAAADYQEFRSAQGTPGYADARLYLLLHDHAVALEEQGRAAAALDQRDQADRIMRQVRGADAGPWLSRILACLAGDLQPQELVNGADPQNDEQVCEGYYYAGEACLLRDRVDAARRWFQRCVDTQLLFDADRFPPDPMSEYHLARWRLRCLEDGIPATGPQGRPEG